MTSGEPRSSYRVARLRDFDVDIGKNPEGNLNSLVWAAAALSSSARLIVFTSSLFFELMECSLFDISFRIDGKLVSDFEAKHQLIGRLLL